MLSHFKKKISYLSLSKEYFLFSLVIMLTILIMSVFLYSYNYSLYTNIKSTNLQQNATEIQAEFSFWLEEKRKLMREIGVKITDQDSPENLSIITNILNPLGGKGDQDGVPFSLSWALSNGKVIFQSNPNSLLNEKLSDISDLHYFQAARKSPWTLQIAPINTHHNTHHKTSSHQVLSLAMGIENTKGQYLGYLMLDMGMEFFHNHFKQMAHDPNDGFMIVDNSCNILFQSIDNVAASKISDCEPGAIDRLKSRQGFLTTLFSLGTTTYSYYAKLENEPYIIYTGYDKTLLEKDLHTKIFPKLYSFLLMGILCMIILYFFRRKIINPISTLSHCATLISKGETTIKIPRQNSIEMFHLAKALLLVKHYIRRNETYRKKLEIANETIQSSTKAREDFIQSINKEITHPLREIMIYSEILLKEIMQKSHSAELIEQSVTCIEKIREATANIKSKTSNALNLSTFNIKDTMEQAIQINLKQSLNRNIHLQYTAAKDIPWMYGDALKLKQIFVGLLSQSIENSPENQVISISMVDYCIGNQPTVKIIIQDHSFGLSEDELQKIQQKIGWHEEDHLFSTIDFSFIEKLVKVHHGTFNYENKLHKGRTITFTFPLLGENDFVTEKNKNNLYYLYQ